MESNDQGHFWTRSRDQGCFRSHFDQNTIWVALSVARPSDVYPRSGYNSLVATPFYLLKRMRRLEYAHAKLKMTSSISVSWLRMRMSETVCSAQCLGRTMHIPKHREANFPATEDHAHVYLRKLEERCGSAMAYVDQESKPFLEWIKAIKRGIN